MARKDSLLQGKPKIIGGNILVIILLVVSVACASVYAREGESGPLHTVQNAVGMIVSPLQFVGSGIAYAEDAASDAVDNATASSESYVALREENARLKAQIAEMEEYRSEAQRLEGLLDLQDRYQTEGVTGRVIGRSADAWNRVITVDVGSNAGVELGLPVVGSSGIVGQVIEVTPLTCKVRLITDPQSGVSALLQSSRAEGILTGSIEGLLYFEDLDASVEVSVGDVVVTSGLGGTYFRGMAVGTVVNVINSAGTTSRTIIVSPFSETSALEEVSVVTAMHSEGELAGGSDGTSSEDGE